MQTKYEIDEKISKFELWRYPVVIRVKEFTEDSAKEFSEQISLANNTSQPIIPVIIDSYGGSVYALLSMLSDIENSDIPVATIAVGKAMSAGAVLLSFGTKGHRYCDPHAHIMVHQVRGGTHGKTEDIQVSAEHYTKINDKMLKEMATRCGHEPEYFLELLHENGNADLFFDAEETLKHKIVDHVRVPKLTVKCSVEMKFK